MGFQNKPWIDWVCVILVGLNLCLIVYAVWDFMGDGSLRVLIEHTINFDILVLDFGECWLGTCPWLQLDLFSYIWFVGSDCRIRLRWATQRHLWERRIRVWKRVLCWRRAESRRSTHKSMKSCWVTLKGAGLFLRMVMGKMESEFMIQLEERLVINAGWLPFGEC